MAKEWDPETVFDVLGCETARQILTVASTGPVTAAELAKRCGVSPPTVYRRLDALQEYDMISEQAEIDANGHHYRRFRTDLKEARFTIDDGSFDVDVRVQTDYADRFSGFWQALGTEADAISRRSRSSLSQSDLQSGTGGHTPE